MSRVYNFGAGPAMLADEVLEQAREEFLDFCGTGMSVAELSHRGPEFSKVLLQAEADLRELLDIPPDYRILFLQGGATNQFAMVPLNLGLGRSADYVCTGQWSQKAILEAQKHLPVNVVVDSESSGFTNIPEQNSWKLHRDAAYVHYTPNETIAGVEFNWVPKVGPVPLVADMSSNILSRVIDVSLYGLIYAGSQKNIGLAGLTLVIIRNELLGRAASNLPTMLVYRTHVENKSLYNTPPTFAIYIAGLTFRWLKRQGGIAEIERRNITKAKLIYDFLDRSALFVCPVARQDRSRMNVRFVLRNEALNDRFLVEAKECGLQQLKGHRLMGGMRASIYNAMPVAGVQALVDFMADFEARHS